MNKLPFRIHGANCESQQNFVTKIEYLAQVNHPVENTDAININSEKSTGRNEEALKELGRVSLQKLLSLVLLLFNTLPLLVNPTHAFQKLLSMSSLLFNSPLIIIPLTVVHSRPWLRTCNSKHAHNTLNLK